MLECVLQGVPENSNILPGLDNEKPRHCFQATSGPSTVQFLSVCKKVGKESQTGEARRSVSGPVGHLHCSLQPCAGMLDIWSLCWIRIKG